VTARRGWTLGVVCAATAVLLIDVTAVSVALPAIERDLGASFDELQWVVDAYALALAATLLTAGSLADRHGRRRVFVAGLAVFALASAACGLARSPEALDLARAAQGLGAAGMFATSLALLAAVYPPRERGAALGIWGAVSGAALAVGPLAGGAVVDGLGWEWIFLANVPIALALGAAALARLPESRDPGAAAIDVPGMVTFSGALALAVLALIRGNAEGWGSAPIVGALAGSALLLGAFVVVELRRERPMLDLRLFRIPAFAGTAAVAFAQSAAIYPMLLFLAVYFQNVLGHTPLETGLRALPLTLALFAAAPLAGRLTGRVALRWLLAAGLVLIAAGLLLMRGLTPESEWTALLPGFLVGGAGMGVISPALAAAMVGVLPAERAGLASGINNTFRQVGIAAGIAGLGAIFEHRVAAAGGASRAGMVEGLNEVFLVAAVVAVAGLAACALVRPRDFAA
jgi:EmrB/QacA subfamily drug resistance transporter